jgi:hypothetical protein
MSDIWRFAPQLPFSETLSFLTDLQIAELAESRTSVRLGRMVYEMAHWFDNAANLEAEGIFDARRLTTLRVPAWAEATELPATLAAGQTVLPVNAADWRVGGDAWVVAPGRAGQAVPITTVGGGTITLAVATAVPVKFVMPLRVCKATEALMGSRVFDGLSRRQTTFVTQDNVDLAAHDMPTVDGLMVMNDGPNGGRGMEQGMIHPVETVDDGPGGVVILPTRAGVDHRVSMTFTDAGPAACWRRRQFWHALRGRATAFWMPSFARDLVLREQIDAADVILRLVAPGWSPGLLTGRVLTLDDGFGRVHRKVTGITVDGADWIVAISGAVGRTVGIMARVSIARRMRLDRDDVQLTHLVPAMGLMQSSAAAVGVP